MSAVEESVRRRLFELQDLEYKAFQCKLIPTVAPDTVIGVRTPELRKYAKELYKTPAAAEFMELLPHKYYDERNLHGFLIEHIRDFDAALAATERFLPCVDNWATCDLMRPKAFSRNLPMLDEHIRRWIGSGETYTVRFGIEMCMSFYLGDAFDTSQADMIAELQSGEYYVNMMVAWYFATALAKQPDAVLPYFSEKRLPDWTHNKAIQKCQESFRIDADTKAYLKTLKIQG